MKFDFKKLLVGAVIIVVLAVFFLRGDQLIQLSETIQQGSLIPLVAAVFTQLCKYFSQSFGYSFCFEAVHEKMDPRATLPLVFGSFFMNTVAPSLNLAGMTLVVDDARRRGIDPGKASSAALLMQITIDGAFVTLMIVGFAITVLFAGMSPLWFIPGVVVILLVVGMVAIMFFGRLSPRLLLKLTRPVENLVNKVLRLLKKPPKEPWAERVIGMFSDAAGFITENPRPALKAYGCSLFASLCELACFSLVGVAFGVKDPVVLLCGYVIATLFAMVSFTPQGVGFVEAAVVVAFTAFGQSAAAGTAIGLVYRGIVFWIPFIIGAVLITRTKTFAQKKRNTSGEKARSARAQRFDRAVGFPPVSPHAHPDAEHSVPQSYSSGEQHDVSRLRPDGESPALQLHSDAERSALQPHLIQQAQQVQQVQHSLQPRHVPSTASAEEEAERGLHTRLPRSLNEVE